MDWELLQSRLVDHALLTGYFEVVNQSEPKVAPGTGMTAAFWVQRIGPVPTESGLRTTNARIEYWCRLYTGILQDPPDAIDPRMIAATTTLMGQYSANFTLGGLIQSIDLLGKAGAPLHSEAGYLEQDNMLYRITTITIPILVNDLWEQTP